MTYESGKPLAPGDLGEAVSAIIPPAVFDAFNELIVANWNGGQATVYQEDAVKKIEDKMSVSRTEVFAKGWLNVEPAYRAQGWKVEYDKPAYNESYRASFVFTKK